MRLRNLYELAVAPGERKGFSLRLKKLEDLQMKIAEMQNTIANLKGTSVPDVLKKQMTDLIDAASMEKEKLYSEIESAEGRNKTANGIPGNVVKLLKGIEKNATTIMNAYRNTGKFLYRGIKSDDDALYGKPFDERRPKDSNSGLNSILNKALAAAGFAARRDNTSFTSGTYSQASNYGTVYIFFPRDGFHFHYSKSIKDLVLDTGKMNLLIDNELVEKIRSILSTNWTEVDHYFSGAYSSSEFLSGYSYESDLRGLQKAVADGKLPAELGKFQTLQDFVDPAKVISQMQYDQSDLDGAINSGHEVMVTGPYYALRADKFADYINKYIEMSKTGSVDITPDTTAEAGYLADKINAILGQKPDGFLIGDWVEHKFETGLKGEIVNNFYTNDFLLVKTYEGNLELIKNSNATKIDAPTIPNYKIDDKLYIRSKGTSYAKFNNKYGKVVSIDGSMVTVSYGGYYNATVPIMLTEPAPKYDSANPTVGDTIQINDGPLAGSYGVITYVSSYGHVDAEIDGDTESISNGTFTVIDPATKKVDNSTPKFEVDDFIEIKGDPGNDSWAGFVGVVVKPGTATSRVRIMYGDEDFGAPKSVKIPNNNINKITKEDFESRALKYGDAVNVTGGKHAGKTGKVTYFYSTGTVEMSTSDGGYMEAKLNNVNLASALAADSADSSEIKKDDKVTITAGLYKGLTGTVAIMGAGAGAVVDLGNHSVNIKKDELKKEKATAALSTNTISVGDSVKIISGSDVGTIGVITKLGKGGTYIKLDNGDNMYVFNSTIEKIDGPDDDLIDLDDIDFETFDEPDKSTPPVKNDVPNFTEGDKVKVISGPNEGKTGKVSYVWLSMPVIDVKFDDGGFQGDIPYADLEVVGEDTIKFKQGDIVNIKDGALYAGLNGKILNLFTDSKQAQVQFGNGQKVVYDFNSLDLMSEAQPNANKFEIGDTVTVTSGNFKDFDGTITSDINSSNEYTVNIVMYGKNVPVSLNDYDLSLSKAPTKNNQQAVKDLIKKGKADGKVTYADLNTAFPAGSVDSEQVADIMDMLAEMGIDIVDETGLFEPSGDAPEQLLAAVSQPGRKQGLLDVFKDPVAKLYIKNSVDSKYMSNEILIELVGLIGYDKYVDFVQPYLELKGVTIGS